jgi:uncharacterized membrane protein YphA (DoxX/SURF4 family)
MAYSHSRLRKTLAVVRIVTGAVFCALGGFKVSSVEFGRTVFPAFLDQGINGGSVTWMRGVLEWVITAGPVRVGVAIGFVEISIGVALLLGLLVRPAALMGMIYTFGLFLTTWNQVQAGPSMLQSTEHQFRNLFPLLVFLLIGVGHAGETWGVGALYHHHRDKRWERENLEPAAPPADVVEAHEPASFEEFADMEAQRARKEIQELTELAVRDAEQREPTAH